MINGYIHNLKCDYLDRKTALKGEVERQLIHLSTGITLIFLIQAAGNMALPLLLILLAFYMTISIAIFPDKLPLPLSAFLCRWGRPSKQAIPLKGTILLLSGTILSFILFPEEIVYASIAIVAFGDSVATAIGVLIGRHKLPYSGEKNHRRNSLRHNSSLFSFLTFCNSCSGFYWGCRWDATGKHCKFANNSRAKFTNNIQIFLQ
ncbi:MAG: hypothetical protein PHH67_02175 [Methanosarcina sp.]|jgi:hypothetical protein|nr:hypothetical protein [Methanosarcina sp.]MDD4305312.1 hypothetical protein [Methanosarcina sp.]